MYFLYNMNSIFRKILIVIFIFILSVLQVNAEDKIDTIANINQNFSADDIPKEIKFKLDEEIILNNRIIHKNSVITAEPLVAQPERRWHKSGFIVLNLKYYESLLGQKVNVSDKDIYLIAKKYDKITVKEATLKGTEIAASTAASFFIPGIDIIYYFTKGAIQKEKNNNRFKAGISNAYDNSIFWFWLKGKPIDLSVNETVSLKEIDEERALKLKSQIEKRKEKQYKKIKNVEADIIQDVENLDIEPEIDTQTDNFDFI